MKPSSGPAGRLKGTSAIVNNQSPRWEQLRPLITRLYVDQDMTLAEVQQVLERTQHFTALTPTYRRKLRQWNLVKNLRSTDMEQILQSLRCTNEKDLQKRSSDKVISHHGQIVCLSDLKRYLRRQRSSRTASPAEDKTTIQPSAHHHKFARQTETPVRSDSMSTMTLRGSPLPTVLEIDDGHSSSLPTERPPGAVADYPAGSQESSHLEPFGVQKYEHCAFLEVDAASTVAGDTESAMDVESSKCSSSGPRMNRQEPRQLFACPFHKYDPTRYSVQNTLEGSYRKCGTAMLSSLPRVKQHVWRVHAHPAHYCVHCFQTFSNEQELQSHQKARMCRRASSPFSEKASPEKLKLIKRRHINRDPVQTWFAIYEILFPGAKKPSSPYVDEGLPANLDDITTFFEKHGQAMMHNIFNDKLEAISLDPSAKACIKGLLKDTTVEFMSRITSNSSPTTPSTDRGKRAVSNTAEACPASTVLLSPDKDVDGEPFTPVASDIGDNFWKSFSQDFDGLPFAPGASDIGDNFWKSFYQDFDGLPFAPGASDTEDGFMYLYE